MTRDQKDGPDDRAEPIAVPPCIESAGLFSEGREIRISHRGDIYRLRITAQQKLILTK